jgi:hypothetical protein
MPVDGQDEVLTRREMAIQRASPEAASLPIVLSETSGSSANAL